MGGGFGLHAERFRSRTALAGSTSKIGQLHARRRPWKVDNRERKNKRALEGCGSDSSEKERRRGRPPAGMLRRRVAKGLGKYMREKKRKRENRINHTGGVENR